MLNIDYNDAESIVRSNIGDPTGIYVSNETIDSALTKYNGDVVKASILIMETMLTWFSTQADMSKTDEVEYRYLKLFERYKSRLQEFKSENASIKRVPILIGGTSLSDKNNVHNDSDSFTSYDMDAWQTVVQKNRLEEDDRIL